MSDGFRAFLNVLEAKKEVLHIRESLCPVHEIPAVMRLMDRRCRKAVLFEKVKGYSIPVVWNLLGSKRLAMAMGLAPDADVSNEFYRRTEKPIKPKIVKEAPVLEVSIKEPDVLKAIPVLTHHSKDVSPYLTSATTFAKDPETGLQSMGIHRVQVKSPRRLGIFLASPPLFEFLKKAEAMGRDLEIAIVIGIHPLTWLSAVTYAPSAESTSLIWPVRSRKRHVKSCNAAQLIFGYPRRPSFSSKRGFPAAYGRPRGPLGSPKASTAPTKTP